MLMAAAVPLSAGDPSAGNLNVALGWNVAPRDPNKSVYKFATASSNEAREIPPSYIRNLVEAPLQFFEDDDHHQQSAHGVACGL